jgi:hypothetical protein
MVDDMQDTCFVIAGPHLLAQLGARRMLAQNM